MFTQLNKLTIIILVQTIFLTSRTHCDTDEIAKSLLDSIEIKDPYQSRCCNLIYEDCEQRKKACVDFITPRTLAHTCKCVPTMEYEMKRYLDYCFRQADETIAVRLERELNRMVIRKMPLQTEGSDGSGHQFPGEFAGTGSKVPGLVNKFNNLKLPSDFGLGRR